MDLCGLRPAWSIYLVPGQPRVYEILPENKTPITCLGCLYHYTWSYFCLRLLSCGYVRVPAYICAPCVPALPDRDSLLDQIPHPPLLGTTAAEVMYLPLP